MRSSIITLVLIFVSSTVAYAGKIITPGITRSNTLNQRVSCTIANSTSKSLGPIEVTIFRDSGVAAFSSANVFVAAGGMGGIFATDAQLAGSFAARCVVEGKGISKKKTPVTLCISSDGDFDCQALVTVQ